MLIELLMFNKICIYNKSIAEVLLLSKLYFELEDSYGRTKDGIKDDTDVRDTVTGS